MGTRLGIGVGYTKKESHQEAAKIAIHKIRYNKNVQHFINNLKDQMYGIKDMIDNYPDDGEFNMIPSNFTTSYME